MLKKALNWRPNPPFFYGWLVLGMGALGAFVATTFLAVTSTSVISFNMVPYLHGGVAARALQWS